MRLREMVRRFVYVRKGSLAIDTELIDWTKPFNDDCVFTLSELRNDIGRDPVNWWLKGPGRRTFNTVGDALRALNPLKHALDSVEDFEHFPFPATKEMVDTLTENAIERINREVNGKAPPWGGREPTLDERLMEAIARRDAYRKAKAPAT